AASCKTPRPVGRYDADKVVASLASGSASEREWAEKSLDLSEPDVAWAPLVRLFEDPAKSSPIARAAAIRIFSRNATYDRPLPPPAAAALVTDPDVQVRRESLRAIIAFGNPDLRRFLNQANEAEKDPALKAEIGKALAEEWLPGARKWWRARITRPSTETEYLLSVRALGSQGIREDVSFLIDSGEKPPPNVGVTGARYEILVALTNLGGPEANDFVRGKLTSDDASLRAVAAAMEERIKDPAAVPALGKLLAADDVIDIRLAAIRALNAIGSAEALSTTQESCRKVQPAGQVKLACKVALAGKPPKPAPASSPKGTRASAK
ncbi:MAG TPA: HEAT repeat domain-containing protein, partial [bacterium]|nr:HEAT repeat domain-containing protein [bacterium]